MTSQSISPVDIVLTDDVEDISAVEVQASLSARDMLIIG